MQDNLCWLFALVFSSHDAASPCFSMHFQQFLFRLVSPYNLCLFWIHIVPPRGLYDVFVGCLYVRTFGMSFRQPDLQNLYIRQYGCLERGWVFWERNHSFINPQVPVSIEKNQKTRTSKTLLTTPHATYFQFRRKTQSYDSLIGNREKMHQKTLNFGKEDTEGKHSALKGNQQKTAWLQGIQSTDNSDVTEQRAARLGHLLISSMFLELKLNESSTSISHKKKKQIEIKRKHVFLEVYLSPMIDCSAGDSANCTCLNFKVTLYLLLARESRDWQSLIPESWK